MRRLFFAGALLSITASTVLSCTIFTTVSLSGLESEGGVSNNGCRNVLTAVSACGACMETQAGAVADQLCAQNKYAITLSDMETCAKDPRVGSSACSDFFPASDASISGSTDPAALQSNIEVLIGKNCEAQCQFVYITYTGCSGKTVRLEEATACGKCITEQCRGPLVTARNKGGISSAPLTACGKSDQDCQGSPDCSGLTVKPDAGYSGEMLSVFSCVKSACSGICPGL